MPIFTNQRQARRYNMGWKCQKCGGFEFQRFRGKRYCKECGWKNLG